MPDLKTSYMGIGLKNPLVLGACNLSENIDSAKKLENEGIAAIVFKSLFEEQIIFEKIQIEEFMDENAERHAEMVSVFPAITHAGPKEHLFKLKKIRDAVNIPLIASLNCINKNIWVDYAVQLEETGIDGLELNFFTFPASKKEKSSNIEKAQLEVISSIISAVKIPVGIKINYFYTNLEKTVIEMVKAGIKGFVFFNKVFTPDINLKTKKYFYPLPITGKHENKIPLRFTAMLAGQINADICSSTGIFDFKDTLHMLLAGASCVQMVSSVYKSKMGNIAGILSDLNHWMQKNNFTGISEFQGLLSKKKIKDPFFLEREQYIDILNNNETIIKKNYRV